MAISLFILRLIVQAAAHPWALRCGTAACPVCDGRDQVIGAIHALEAP